MTEASKDALYKIGESLYKKLQKNNANLFSGKEMFMMTQALFYIDCAMKEKKSKSIFFVKFVKKLIALQPAERAITPREALTELAAKDAEIVKLKQFLKKNCICIECGTDNPLIGDSCFICVQKKSDPD